MCSRFALNLHPSLWRTSFFFLAVLYHLLNPQEWNIHPQLSLCTYRHLCEDGSLGTLEMRWCAVGVPQHSHPFAGFFFPPLWLPEPCVMWNCCNQRLRIHQLLFVKVISFGQEVVFCVRNESMQCLCHNVDLWDALRCPLRDICINMNSFCMSGNFLQKWVFLIVYFLQILLFFSLTLISTFGLKKKRNRLHQIDKARDGETVQAAEITMVLFYLDWDTRTSRTSEKCVSFSWRSIKGKCEEDKCEAEKNEFLLSSHYSALNGLFFKLMSYLMHAEIRRIKQVKRVRDKLVS